MEIILKCQYIFGWKWKATLILRMEKEMLEIKLGFYFILSQCFSVGFFPHIQAPKKKIFIKWEKINAKE